MLEWIQQRTRTCVCTCWCIGGYKATTTFCMKGVCKLKRLFCRFFYEEMFNPLLSSWLGLCLSAQQLIIEWSKFYFIYSPNQHFNLYITSLSTHGTIFMNVFVYKSLLHFCFDSISRKSLHNVCSLTWLINKLKLPSKIISLPSQFLYKQQ